MNVFAFVSDLFIRVFRKLKPIFAAVFTTAFQILLAKLKDIAIEAITEMATSNMTNEDKRKEVFRNIKAYAIRTGLSFNERDINLIIEILYNQLRNQKVIL